MQTDLAKAQRAYLSDFPQTADILQLGREVDRGLSPEDFDAKVLFIREGAEELADAPLFAQELESAIPFETLEGVEITPTNVAPVQAVDTDNPVVDVQSSRTFELPPEPSRIDPATGRPIYDSRAEAMLAKEAEGVLFPTSSTNLSETVDGMSLADRADAVLALSQEEIAQLGRVVQALESSTMVPLEDFNAHVGDILEKINNRQGSLHWNPASIGSGGTVYSVKIDQKIDATVIGYTPTSDLEDLMLALKKLGLGEGTAANAPSKDFTGPAAVRNASGNGWTTQNEADAVAARILSFSGKAKDWNDLLPDFRNDTLRLAVAKASDDLDLKYVNIGKNNKGFVGIQSAFHKFAMRLHFSENPVISHTFGVVAESDVFSKGTTDSFRLSQPIDSIAKQNTNCSEQTGRND